MTERLKRFSNCVQWPAHDVDRPGGLVDLIEGARDVSRARFVALTDTEDRLELEDALGYNRRKGQPGIAIVEDYHVRYKTGLLHGVRVAFLVHSAIEYVFTPAGYTTP
jgi:hypothetical protein